MRWSDLTTRECDATRMARAVVVLPVAAIEQHGPHLPLSVDSDIAAALLDAAERTVAGRIDLLSLPLQCVGFSQEHDRFPGTLTHDPETVRRMWTELGASVAAAGARRLLILNGHGGNPPVMEIVARDLRARLGMLVGQVGSYALGTPARWFPDDELRYGIHGGAVETSLMLHLHPDKVRTGEIATFASAAGDWDRTAPSVRIPSGQGPSGQAPAARSTESAAITAAIGWLGPHAMGWQAQDLNPSGAVGDARLATAEAGAMLFESMVADLARVLCDFAAAPLPADRSDRGLVD